MKKILCPTDFSPAAQNAVRYAAKLCQSLGAKLTLFNVQSVLELTPSELLRGKEFIFETYKQQLEEEACEVARMFRISCTAIVESSNVSLAEAIARSAAEYDILVVGTSGMEGFVDLVEGSNAYHTIQKSGVPTFIIPENALYSEVKKIVYPFDFLRRMQLPVEDLRELFGTADVETTVVELLEPSVSVEMDAAVQDSEFIITDRNPDLKLKFESIHTSNTASAIREYVNKANPDLLVVYSQHKNFFQKLFHRSVIKDLAAVATFPILVVHK